MIKGITKDEHGIADLTYVPLVLLAPKLVGFTENKVATRSCYWLAGSALLYSMFTDAKWGVVKLIAYKTHAMLDLGAGVASLALAGTVKPSGNRKATNTLLAMGLTGLVVGALSLIGAKERS